MAKVIVDRAARGEPVLGLCGGCQMLGQQILDPDRVESDETAADGLGLLSHVTHFERAKMTAQVVARPASPSFLTAGLAPTTDVRGYEIHMGRIEPAAGAAAALHLHLRNGQAAAVADGGVSPDGAVVGTMVHGIFENEAVRAALLGSLRRRRGLSDPTTLTPARTMDDDFDRLAAMLREHVDLTALRRLAGIAG